MGRRRSIKTYKEVFSFSRLLTALPARVSRMVERSYPEAGTFVLKLTEGIRSIRDSLNLKISLKAKTIDGGCRYGYDSLSCWRKEG